MSSTTTASIAPIRWVQFALVVAIAAWGVVVSLLSNAAAKDLVADPARAFVPEMPTRSSSLGDVMASWPALVSIIVLISLLLLVTFHDIGSGRKTETGYLWPIVLGAFIMLVGIIFGFALSLDRTEATFATWAHQRYGIDLEDYPHVKGVFGDEQATPSDDPITLDDGQVVRMEQLVDARGNEAFVVVSDDDDAELPVIAQRP